MKGNNKTSTIHAMVVGPPFYIDNGLRYKKGGLIIQQDNDIKDMIVENIMA